MQTRCPRCQTHFRITPEQLRARGGKVRCGHCHAVFNALETLVEEQAAPPVSEPWIPAAPAHETPAAVEPAPAPEPQPEPAPEPAVEPEPYAWSEPYIGPEPAVETEPAVEPEMPGEPEAEPAPEPEPPIAPAAQPEPPFETEAAPEAPDSPSAHDETPEESTQAAREAGLVAVRDLAETPAYSRWAAGTLASSPLAGLETEPRHGHTWLFTLAALLLSLGLATQLIYHFRTELVQRLPALEAAFKALDIDVPLPRQADLVSIETSDLQSDNARGLLALQATLKNRAAYAQAWPALELTLTDAHDAVVARRVLEAPDYLPPSADAGAFPANSETVIRLWIEPKDVAAAGYRLYVFYP
ncbi:MAG: finger-like region [Rhodocyclaceae bacterium]|nr:finger-like region [Rhodocyclaceae bacterium]